ncbi:autotransporter outer membrane beta-barrel domain-containing protein [Pseudomonas caspiana]|nr:autotransporter outer membrane beta-barrel domain-containing protein [Pseudomonas caspiana]
MLAISPLAWAGALIPDEPRTIGPGSPAESWLLGERSSLTALPGTQLFEITALDGSTLNIDGGTVTSGAAEGITLLGATATLNNTNVTSTASYGLLIERDGSLIGGPSSASITGGSITGVDAGVYVTYQSAVALSGTVVNGIGDGSADPFSGGTGIAVEGGTAIVRNGSSVKGSAYGVYLGTDILGGLDGANTSLTVDGSSITGTSQSAIYVASFEPGTPTNATISIANGSVLTGGNGLAIEVANDSSAVVQVDNSTLQGGILINPASTGTVALNNNARIIGDVTNVATMTMNNGSTLTGDLTGSDTLSLDNNSSITGNVSHVTDFTLDNGSSLTGNVSDTTNLSANNGSRLTGDISNVQQLNLAGNSSITGNLSGVENLSLDNSTWTTNSGSGVTNLSMNAGAVKLGENDGTFETLTVSTLSGNGRFIIDTDLAAHQSDFIDVTGVATGNYDLQIKNTGVEPVKGDQDQQVVHTGTGSDAEFGVVGGQVDVGTFAYELEQRGTDWFLVQKLDDDGGPITTPGTRSVIGLFSAAPTVWYGELTSLRSRMGELRYGKTEGGAWVRAYGNKFNMSAAGGTAYQQNQQGISYGADVALPSSSGQWLVGVLGGYSRSDLDIAAGTTGRVDSYYLGAYTTWLSDSGYYVDAIIKANRFKNQSDVRMSDGTKSDGDYTTNGIGASIEAGKHIKLADNWFVEPFIQGSALWVSGENYSLDNGMNASSNQADSFLGKAGTNVGRNFPLQGGGFIQPYVKVAVAHEFAKSNRVKVNSTTFSNDLSGSRGELGAGIAAQVTEVLQLHADVDYSKGENIEQPWGVNVGLRYSW